MCLPTPASELKTSTSISSRHLTLVAPVSQLSFLWHRLPDWRAIHCTLRSAKMNALNLVKISEQGCSLHGCAHMLPPARPLVQRPSTGICCCTPPAVIRPARDETVFEKSSTPGLQVILRGRPRLLPTGLEGPTTLVTVTLSMPPQKGTTRSPLTAHHCHMTANQLRTTLIARRIVRSICPVQFAFA